MAAHQETTTASGNMDHPPNEKGMIADHVEDFEHNVKRGILDAELLVKEGLRDEADLNDEVVKKLIRKVDYRLIPPLAFLYAIALVDRNNLPNARLAGMDQELRISVGNRYTILVMMFFIPYILFELPANLAMRKVGPAKWLGAIGFAWGVVTIGMGFVHTWGALLSCRVLFGAFEAGLFPGSIYLMSCWYKRYEVQKRFSGFFCVGLFCSGASGLIAYGIQHMQGLAGFKGWRWIFIIEGIASCAIAIIALIVLIDFPDRAAKPGLILRRAFLTNEEVSIILARIARDRGDAVPEQLTWKRLFHYLGDWKIWEFGVLICCNNMFTYSFSFFLPLILKESLGYSLGKTYALVLPPSCLAVIWMFVVAYVGDKFHFRGPIIVFDCLIGIMGVCMMAFATSPTTRYVGVFFGVATTSANIPAIFSYQHNNIVGQMKRAVGTAILVGGGGCGGVIVANAFRQQDAPKYLPGLYTCIAVQALSVVLVSKNFLIFYRQNRKADRGETVIEGTEGFRYTY